MSPAMSADLSCSPIPIPEFSLSEWEKIKNVLSGPLHYTLTNDFMFKMFLQENLYALKGFFGGFYGIDPEEIKSITILNPIIPGDMINDKIVILDLRLVLNSNQIIDIEMQVASQFFFPERILTYLCRSFDHLKPGESYDMILPCVQISILDGELFPPEDPRYTDAFLSEYRLTEKDSGKEFSDKFKLFVVSLKHLENATDKENPNGLYQWAKLFAATTWEDIKMIVENNNYMKSAAFCLKELTDDDKVRMACEARRNWEADLQSNYSAGVTIGKAEGIAEGKAEAKAEFLPVIEDQKKALSDLTAEVERLKALLGQHSD